MRLSVCYLRMNCTSSAARLDHEMKPMVQQPPTDEQPKVRQLGASFYAPQARSARG
jgi:hypothetical protein